MISEKDIIDKAPNVIYLDDVNLEIQKLYKGQLYAPESTYNDLIDEYFKWLSSELTLFSGYPGHGKSTFLNYLTMLKSINDGTKWAYFSPESYPAGYFYSELINLYIGYYISNLNYEINIEAIANASKFIKEHFFYVHPTVEQATPKFINDTFLKLFEYNGVKGCITDPFNQLEHDWNKHGRDDRYLSDYLSFEKEFAKKHDCYKIIIAHPSAVKMSKDFEEMPDPNYYSLAGGAMWANKCDNIIMVHRPKMIKDIQSPLVKIIIEKIKKQPLVGKKGYIYLNHNWKTKRYEDDYGNDFYHKKIEIKQNNKFIYETSVNLKPSDDKAVF